MKVPKRILIIQGAQYGSEGKGGVTAYMANFLQADYAIRTGSINAGHTVVRGNQKVVTQQVPAAWVNPETKLVIGPGAYIHIPTLEKDIAAIKEATGEDVRNRLLIDYRCHLHTAEDEAAAKEAGRHLLMGATGKGCAEAIVRKIQNRGSAVGPRLEDLMPPGYTFADVPSVIAQAWAEGAQIVIEGTQGTGLDMHLGLYPFVTSRSTIASAWIAECGLPPSIGYDVMHVVRTHPIRVAGNSGPLPGELSWLDLVRGWNSRRTMKFDMPPVCDPAALDEFEKQCRNVADSWEVPLPDHEDGLHLHEWTDDERSQFREGASKFHRSALGEMSIQGLAEVMKVFEMTTVTKKLRRIGTIDPYQLHMARITDNPMGVVITFWNYLFPEMWNMTQAQMELAWSPVHAKAVTGIRKMMLGGLNIFALTTGPDVDKHFITLNEEGNPASDPQRGN